MRKRLLADMESTVTLFLDS
ncbi:mCG125810, isoform CRA_b [Mus musculus]|nr:mCG125810, isoform CRA_b [Mus musculus]